MCLVIGNIGVITVPLLRGGGLVRVVAGGCFRYDDQHTPPPLSRGESHHPNLEFDIFLYFSIAQHVKLVCF
jgi:hypothetical protein